jgi:hypothetical protein
MIFITCLFLFHCKEKARPEFAASAHGYIYRLLTFENKKMSYDPENIGWISATFCTQNDSVFWDSNNNLGDRYFLRLDTTIKHDAIAHYLATASEGDSACLLIDPVLFYRQQFRSVQLPYFTKNDTVVKVYLKLTQILTPLQFREKSANLLERESDLINTFFGSDSSASMARDEEGFYFITPDRFSDAGLVSPGDLVTVNWAGSFLNGQLLERSNGDFTFTYGAPGQVLEGVNIVIGRLNLGQNVKIILPSPLAFGETGSSDKTVPPFTPLVYEVTLKAIKKQDTP